MHDFLPPASFKVRKLFWDDPYLTALDTTITSVAGADLTVAATIFYAFSGGQESDAGSIAGRPVIAARKDGAQIVYTLPEGHGLATGDAVRIEIDWERRYRLMRLHFAAELVLELADRMLGRRERSAPTSRRTRRASTSTGRRTSPGTSRR